MRGGREVRESGEEREEEEYTKGKVVFSVNEIR